MKASPSFYAEQLDGVTQEHDLSAAADHDSWGGSNKAAEAALFLVKPVEVIEKNPSEFMENVTNQKENREKKGSQDLLTELKKKRLKARLLLKEREAKYLRELKRSKTDARALKLIQFTPSRLLGLRAGFKEALALLLGHILAIYSSQFQASSKSTEYCKAVSEWSVEFLSYSLTLLGVEETSPALCFIFDFLRRLVRDEQGNTYSYRSHSECPLDKKRSKLWLGRPRARSCQICPLSDCLDSLADVIMNPQPAKANLLAQCDTFLKDDISSMFAEAVQNESKVAHEFQDGPLEGYMGLHKASKPIARGYPLDGETTGTDSEVGEFVPLIRDNVEHQHFVDSSDDSRVDDNGLNPPSPHTVLIRDLLLMYILTGKFDSRVYEVMRRFAIALDMLPLALIFVCQDFLDNDVVGTMQKETKETNTQKTVRRLKVAGVALGIGLAGALSVGLAAPAIAAGVGALGIAGTSGAVTFLGSLGGSAAVASVFGAGTAGLSGWKYSKRIGKLKVFCFDKVERRDSSERIRVLLDTESEVSGLDCEVQKIENEEDVLLEHAEFVEAKSENTFVDPGPETTLFMTVTICCSGWLRSMADIKSPWRGCSSTTTDVYALRYDPEMLLELGNFLIMLLSQFWTPDLLQKFAVSAAQLWLQYTAAGALSTALMWPIVYCSHATATLDNTWITCRERAVQAGKLLAVALCDSRTIGSRPVILIGYSMGARAIFACLLELHRRKAFHLVSDVVLMGTPTSCDKLKWQKAREVVAGRLINIYCQSDWVLAFLFRYNEWMISVAGLSAVKVEGVENIDVSGIIRSHAQYISSIDDVLTFIGLHAT